MNEQTKIELGEFKWLFESPFCRINKQTQTHTHTNIPTMRNRRPDRNPFPTSCVLIIFICLSRPLRDTHISIVHNSYRVNDDGFSFTKWKKTNPSSIQSSIPHETQHTKAAHTGYWNGMLTFNPALIACCYFPSVYARSFKLNDAVDWIPDSFFLLHVLCCKIQIKSTKQRTC